MSNHISDRRPPTAGHLGQLTVGLRLGQGPSKLSQGRVGLRNLVIELWRDDLGQQLALLDVVSNVDLALGDIAAGAREDIGAGECRGRCRQGQ